MARKSDWSQDSDTEWTLSRKGVQAIIELVDDEDGSEPEFHAMVHDNDDVIADGWFPFLDKAKAEVEAVIGRIV